MPAVRAAASASPPELRRPVQRLTRRAQFLAAARARRAAMPGLNLQARRRTPDEAPADQIGLGFTCSRKVGNAVARNRAKRRLRAAAAQVLTSEGRPGWDYVLIGKAGATATRPFDALIDDLRAALSRVHG